MMENFFADYETLMSQFVTHEMPIEEFCKAYLDKFKNETRVMPEPFFALFDKVFGDVDAFTTDPALLSKNPEFYLDESQLRQEVARAVDLLQTLRQKSGKS